MCDNFEVPYSGKVQAEVLQGVTYLIDEQKHLKSNDQEKERHFIGVANGKHIETMILDVGFCIDGAQEA